MINLTKEQFCAALSIAFTNGSLWGSSNDFELPQATFRKTIAEVNERVLIPANQNQLIEISKN